MEPHFTRLSRSTDFFFFCIPSSISGVHHFSWDFCEYDWFCVFVVFLFNPDIEVVSHILSSWMVHAGCVFVVGIHRSKT